MTSSDLERCLAHGEALTEGDGCEDNGIVGASGAWEQNHGTSHGLACWPNP